MKKFKEIISYIGLDYKKEIRNIVLIILSLLVVNVACFIFIKVIAVSCILFICSPLIIYLYISRYKNIKEKLIKERNDELVSLISYFDIFILNNFNVYNSIQSLIPYCSGWMKDKVNLLLENIDKDKSVTPFMVFAKEFQNPLIENLMISIFQMIEEGESIEGISQFSLLYKEIDKKHQEEMLHKKINSLDSMNVFPLVGAASITVILTIGVLSIIGDLINVV